MIFFWIKKRNNHRTWKTNDKSFNLPRKNSSTKDKKEKLLNKIMIIMFFNKKRTLKTLQNYMHVLLTKHYVLDLKFVLCQNYIRKQFPMILSLRKNIRSYVYM
jgi:hypothetical protein